MLLPKAKLEYSCSSTTLILIVFTELPRIWSYLIANSCCQSGQGGTETANLIQTGVSHGRPCIARTHRVAPVCHAKVEEPSDVLLLLCSALEQHVGERERE